VIDPELFVMEICVSMYVCVLKPEEAYVCVSGPIIYLLHGSINASTAVKLELLPGLFLQDSAVLKPSHRRRDGSADAGLDLQCLCCNGFVTLWGEIFPILVSE